MSAYQLHEHKHASNVGVSPQTPATHQRPVLKAAKGDKRQVVLNGCRVFMEHDGKKWWNVKVLPA